jgi:hypothetical protein
MDRMAQTALTALPAQCGIQARARRVTASVSTGITISMMPMVTYTIRLRAPGDLRWIISQDRRESKASKGYRGIRASKARRASREPQDRLEQTAQMGQTATMPIVISPMPLPMMAQTSPRPSAPPSITSLYSARPRRSHLRRLRTLRGFGRITKALLVQLARRVTPDQKATKEIRVIQVPQGPTQSPRAQQPILRACSKAMAVQYQRPRQGQTSLPPLTASPAATLTTTAAAMGRRYPMQDSAVCRAGLQGSIIT